MNLHVFCKHDFLIERWHFCHGRFGNRNRYIEGYEKCRKYGKERRFIKELNANAEEQFLEKYYDRYRVW